MHLFLVLLVHLQTAFAVKEWMFRNCGQNPFCRRQRSFGTAAISDYTYFITPQSIDTSNLLNLTGVISKSIPDIEKQYAVALNEEQTLAFPFYLEIINDNMFRFVVDEADRKINSDFLANERYSPAEHVIDAEQAKFRVPKTTPKVTELSDHLEVRFGKDKLIKLYYKEVKVEVYKNNELEVVLNDDKLFNIEHLRSKGPGDDPSDWSDTFDGKTDDKVRGPESLGLDTKFVGYNFVYGIPEHSSALSLQDTTQKEPYRLFNVDIFEYLADSPMPMYGSIPFMIAQAPNKAAGVFWLNSADTYVDVRKDESSSSAHWISETGKMDVFVILGDSSRDIINEYGHLTGTSILPQLFGVGYHQCRWNYMSQEELLDVDRNMDISNVPYDTIWLDIEWTDDRRYFRWNSKFPDPQSMMDKLDESKRQLVVLNDPHVKVDPNYNIYNDLMLNKVTIMDNTDKNAFQGHCWPGNSIWVDSLNPNAQSVWSEFYNYGTDIGKDAKNIQMWSDMSEPSVFSGSETTASKEVMHYGGWQHRDVHNVYGNEVFRLTYEGLNHRYEGTQRPFVLTRSFFAGSQKYGPTWTGDNQATWEYLRAATPTILTLGIAGYPYSGADVGGFFKNPSSELLVRWYQAGAFYPFFRAHAHVDSLYREPYLLADDCYEAVKAAIELRYQLLPEFYTKFWESSVNLSPIMRPLFYEAPSRLETYEIDDEFFLGSSLLARPVLTESQSDVEILIPDDQVYYDYFTGESHTEDFVTEANLETIPLYVRGGSVVFRKDRKRRSSELMQHDPYTLLIGVAANGTAYGHLYADDGKSFEYKTNDDYNLLDVHYTSKGIKGSVVHESQSEFANAHIERIIVYGNVKSHAYVEGGDEIEIQELENNTGFILRNPQLKINEDWFIHLE